MLLMNLNWIPTLSLLFLERKWSFSHLFNHTLLLQQRYFLSQKRQIYPTQLKNIPRQNSTEYLKEMFVSLKLSTRFKNYHKAHNAIWFHVDASDFYDVITCLSLVLFDNGTKSWPMLQRIVFQKLSKLPLQ